MRSTIIVLLLALPAIALADFEMHFNDGSSGVVSDGRVLFGNDDSSISYNENEEDFVVIEWNRRSYMRVKPGFADAMKAQMQVQMEQMLADVPPAQREMFEQQMKSRMPHLQEPRKTNLRETGNSDEVAGYDCDEAEIAFDDGAVQSIVCIASVDELGISDGDFRALSSAMKAMNEMASMSSRSSPDEDLEKLGGFPIRSRNTAYGMDNELVSLSTSSVDTSRLQIPDGFREVSMEDMMR